MNAEDYISNLGKAADIAAFSLRFHDAVVFALSRRIKVLVITQSNAQYIIPKK